MFTKNGNILKVNGNWLNPHVEPEPYPFDSVTIGTQTWMAKNLDIDDGGEGIRIINDLTVNGVSIGTVYYYTWAAANRVASNIPGWHLPNKDDLDLFSATVEQDAIRQRRFTSEMVKSRTGWARNGSSPLNNIDYYHFNGQPVDRITYNSNTGTYTWPATNGYYCRYWGSFKSSYEAYSIYLSYNSEYIIGYTMDVYDGITYYNPVRLIKDT